MKYKNGVLVELTEADTARKASRQHRALGHLATPKDRLKDHLAAYRYGIETGGLNGIQTDRETRANLVSARTLAKEDANYTVKWKAANGSFVTLNAAQVIATADAVAAFVAKCFVSEEAVSLAIDAGTHTTEAQVKAAFDTAMEG